jgi:hypothetical protein
VLEVEISRIELVYSGFKVAADVDPGSLKSGSLLV